MFIVDKLLGLFKAFQETAVAAKGGMEGMSPNFQLGTSRLHPAGRTIHPWAFH
jgi:hypothetical protein